jgi:glycosyltransferase involved in cell wall biosynthesis
LFEGFGFITVEAIMNGSLVLGRNTFGTKMIMEETGNANFLFDNNEDLALKMEQIINSDPKDYTNHIKKTQTLAVEKFSTERYGEEMYRIYAKILNKE